MWRGSVVCLTEVSMASKEWIQNLIPGGPTGAASLSHTLYHLQDWKQPWTLLNQLQLHLFFAGENYELPFSPDSPEYFPQTWKRITLTSYCQSVQPHLCHLPNITIPKANPDCSCCLLVDPSRQPQNKGCESCSAQPQAKFQLCFSV